MHHGKYDRADKGRAEGVHMKARHQTRCKDQHERVDHQQEQAERENAERKGQNFQQETERRVQQANDQYRYQRRGPVANVKPGTK